MWATTRDGANVPYIVDFVVMRYKIDRFILSSCNNLQHRRAPGCIIRVNYQYDNIKIDEVFTFVKKALLSNIYLWFLTVAIIVKNQNAEIIKIDMGEFTLK